MAIKNSSFNSRSNIENTIKSTAIMNALKQLIVQQGFHL